MSKLHLRLLIVIASLVLGACAAYAMEPPPPGMIEQMKRDGTYAHAAAFAKQLGNHQLKTPLRGAALPQLPPQQLADMIQQHMGESLDAKGAKAVSAATPQELSWVQLDLNHDRVVDERDVLALGYPQPKAAATFPSLGTIKTFAIQLDFSDYPAWFPTAEIDNNLFGPGVLTDDYKSLNWYYQQASYGQLDIQGAVYPHRASRPRTWYHPDDSADYPDSWGKQEMLVKEAILAADAAGEDFSQYDNDGDGSVDYFLVIWTGPHGAWSTFWWGYFGVGLPGDFRVDGVNFTTYSWQWERYYDFGGTPPEDANWDPYVTIHETGHALGLPDYYDYDGGQGPTGGVGGLDMMSGNWGDHGCFSKYVLGWLAPTVVFSNLDNHPMRPSELFGDAVICMPGFDPVTPWAEYFIAQNRQRIGVDVGIPNDGTLIWHIDSRVNNGGGYQYDNSYTDHWLISLEQADGLFEIENGTAGANAGDFFVKNNVFSDTSTPDTKRYDGSSTNATITDFSDPGDPMTADFILYTSNPPQVTINAPAGGAVCSGTQPISVDATDDVAVTKVQVLIDGWPVYETASASFSYDWNTLVDFNKPLNLTVRAWDAEGQAGTAVVGVSVDNSGLVEYNDDFTSLPSGLEQWRVINDPAMPRGQYTAWQTRATPADPPRTGGGNEAFVNPNGPANEWFGCDDQLRSQRIDATGFTRPVQLKFNYRNRGGLSLWSTVDNGASWQQQEILPGSGEWRSFNRTYALQGQTVYFRLRYQGDVRGDDWATLGAHIADFSVKQCPSDPPTAVLTSPADGAVLSGNMSFDVDATDDNSVAQVVYSINGGEVSTDSNGLDGWNYTRDTVDDDNDPALRIEAVAIDGDGLPSAPAKLTVALRNPKTWPFTDDFEAGLGNWSEQDNGNDQDWSLAAAGGHNAPAALSYDSPGPWVQNSSEGIWLVGPALAWGRQGVDLSDPTCVSPALTYWYNGGLPNGQGINVFFYSTWHGFQNAGGLGGQVPDWERRTVDLTRFRGQSGRIVFWVWGNNQSSGAGAVIDDVSVDNTSPFLDGIFPNTGYPGQVVLLSGNYFGAAQGASTVTFTGPAVCTPLDIISWSEKSIYARVPDGAQDGPVTVTVQAQNSNNLDFTVQPLAISFTGIDSQFLYTWLSAPVPLAVTASAGIERVEAWADGVSFGSSTDVAGGFADLAIDIAKVPNGVRNISVVGFTANSQVTSAAVPASVYSFRGDINGDGVIDGGDSAALSPLVGLVRFQPGYQFWYDPDDDGVVTESDGSWIGYHFGETQP